MEKGQGSKGKGKAKDQTGKGTEKKKEGAVTGAAGQNRFHLMSEEEVEHMEWKKAVEQRTKRVDKALEELQRKTEELGKLVDDVERRRAENRERDLAQAEEDERRRKQMAEVKRLLQELDMYGTSDDDDDGGDRGDGDQAGASAAAVEEQKTDED